MNPEPIPNPREARKARDREFQEGTALMRSVIRSYGFRWLDDSEIESEVNDSWMEYCRTKEEQAVPRPQGLMSTIAYRNAQNAVEKKRRRLRTTSSQDPLETGPGSLSEHPEPRASGAEIFEVSEMLRVARAYVYRYSSEDCESLFRAYHACGENRALAAEMLGKKPNSFNVALNRCISRVKSLLLRDDGPMGAAWRDIRGVFL